MTAEQGIEVRKWCFEQALKTKADLDITADTIYRACEIEAYILNGANVRDDFRSDVDAALCEIPKCGTAGVSAASTEKVMQEVRKWLRNYGALPQ